MNPLPSSTGLVSVLAAMLVSATLWVPSSWSAEPPAHPASLTLSPVSGGVGSVDDRKGRSQLKPSWNNYQGFGVSGGAGGRYGIWAANANAAWLGRGEFGVFAHQWEFLAGVTYNTGPGLWGRASWNINLMTSPRRQRSVSFGVGPSATLVAIHKANVTAGLNVQASVGVDFRDRGEPNMALRATVDVPIPYLGTEGRMAPMLVLSIEGFLIGTTPVVPTSTSRSTSTSSSASTRTTPPPVTKEDAPAIDWKHCTIRHQKILFELNSAELRAESAAVVAEVAEVILSADSIGAVRVEGHTDEQGSASYNLQLSNRRVNAVLEALVAGGVASSVLEGVGMGESDPEVPGARSAEDHAKNRRVLFIIEAGCEEQ